MVGRLAKYFGLFVHCTSDGLTSDDQCRVIRLSIRGYRVLLGLVICAGPPFGAVTSRSAGSGAASPEMAGRGRPGVFMSQALATRVVTIDAGVFIKSTLVKGYQGLLQKSGSNSERDTHNHQERSRKASVGKTPIDRALRRAQKSLDDGDVILSVMLLTKLRGRLWWALATGDVKTLTAEWNADFPSPRGVDVGLRDLERLLRETKRLYRRAIEAYYHWADEHPHDYMAQNRAWFKGMAKVFGWTRRQAFQIDWPKPRCLPPLSRIRTEREAA